MKVSLPIWRDTAARTWCRLVERMVIGSCERCALAEVLSRKVPEPLFAGLETLDYLMPRDPGVIGGMLPW